MSFCWFSHATAHVSFACWDNTLDNRMLKYRGMLVLTGLSHLKHVVVQIPDNYLSKRQIEKSRKSHKQKLQPTPDTRRKRKSDTD